MPDVIDKSVMETATPAEISLIKILLMIHRCKEKVTNTQIVCCLAGGSNEESKRIDGMTDKHLSILDYISSKAVSQDEVTHAWCVAENATKRSSDDRIYIVALLHDVVEDGYTSFEKLQKMYNLDAEQMAALDAITRRNGERYFDYIQRVKQNKIAKIVKLADLQHNIERCARDLPNRWGLIRRYAKAYGILIDEWEEVPINDQATEQTN